MAFEPTGDNKYLIAHCHVREEPLTDELVAKLPADSVFKDLYKVVLMEDPNAGGADCICHSGTAPAVVALLFCFSVCVQAAEGLSFGIVPYISRPALGVVSGMVGAGGNSGAVAMLNLYFKGPRQLPLPAPKRRNGMQEKKGARREVPVQDTFRRLRECTDSRNKLPETLCRAPFEWQKLLPSIWLLKSEFGADRSG